jgi:hypothetical protein
MACVMKKDLCRVGVGSTRRPTSTRLAHQKTHIRAGHMLNRDCQIQQTPDLTSLDPEHLPEETLEKLPYLCKLKESIYSK